MSGPALRRRIETALGRLALRGPPPVAGNRLRLLIDGAAVYPAMHEAISQARRTITLETFFYEPDATGDRFLAALIERARAGVLVRLMVDGVGSFSTPREYFAPLVAAGGRVAVYSAPKPWVPLSRLWRRNHRKVLVVDDTTAYLGGLNIHDEAAPVEWGGEAWHDAHVEVVGPVALRLTDLFNRTWLRVRGEDLRDRRAPAVQPSGSTSVQVLESRIARRYSVRRAYLDAIRQAQHRICISNAYCIPDRGIRRALYAARLRGVQVQILFAGSTDVLAVRFASQALYARLMKRGIEVWEWHERVLHTKTAVIDGAWSNIGSYNLDTRSLLHNLEANLACVDAELGAAVEREFDADLTRSRRIDPETWHRRPRVNKMLEWMCLQLAPLL